MDLKVVFLGVCLCAFAVTYSQAGIPKCCMSTKAIPRRLLHKVQRWEVQNSNGACDIDAVILHVKNYRTPICANPKVKTALLRRKRSHRSHRKDAY